MHVWSFSTATAALVAVLSFPTLAAAEWPQIRGVDRDGVATGEAVQQIWGEEGPAEVWRRPIGAGFSGIAIAGDALYTMDADDAHERALALDAATGATRWATPLGERFANEFGDGPRATPTVAGDTVFAVTADLQLAALATGDGDVRWRHDLAEAFGAAQPRFGYSSSPLIDGDLVILDVGGDAGRGVVAFDKTTGQTRWSALGGAGGHSSPIVAEVAGLRQYVFNRRGETPEMVGLSTGGDVLWRHPGALDAIVMPLFVPPDAFFVSSAAMGDGGSLVRVRRDDDGFRSETAWTNSRMRNHFNTSVLVNGHIYGFDNATFRCLDAGTGDPRWAMRGFGKGSLVASGDRLFVLGDTGTLALVAASAEAYQELGRVEALEGRAWTPPALADGRLYLRDHDEIVAYEVGGPTDAVASTDIARPALAEPSARPTPAAETVETVLKRYAAARGGIDRWRRAEGLKLSGSYATFSNEAPFTLLRGRPDRYRFDFELLGNPATKAQDGDGPWWVWPMFRIVEAARVDPGPYADMIAREARYEPLLIDPVEKGVTVELGGRGELDGRETIELAVSLPGGQVETWHLDAETYLEVAVDRQVHDHTQMAEPMSLRTFYSDFRDVAGLVLPHRLAFEFGARLEEMTVEEVLVDPPLAADAFTGPAPPPPEGDVAADGG